MKTTTKEEVINDNNSLSENTETESNADLFDTEEDEDLTEDEENTWECSLCTYRNTPDALRCLMCDVKKNISTSTRKPRINPKLLAQQVAKQQQQIQQQALKQSSKEKSKAISSEQRKSIAQSLEAMSPTSSTCSAKSVKREKSVKEENGLIDKKSKFTFKSKDVDRASGISQSITINNLTVMITEYPLLNGQNRSANAKQK